MRLCPRRSGTSLDLLVVGLGNPGRDYARNRHNVGSMVVDELARRHAGSWRGKFSGRLAEVRIDGHKVALLKPETYMNESGRSVQAAARFFKVEPDAILVVHDEGDFDLGRLQARRGGGLALLALTCSRTGGASATPAFSDRDDAQLVAARQIQFIAYARVLLGVPYSYGGTSPGSGFDCSGFTRYVYEHFGVELPHYSGA